MIPVHEFHADYGPLVVGEPRRNLVVSERDGLAKARAWLASPEFKALEPQRAKAYRMIRQFIVETAGD
jgi:uncharacterized protein (DUF1330 family)